MNKDSEYYFEPFTTAQQLPPAPPPPVQGRPGPQSQYPHLDRLQQHADQAVGAGYQIVTGWTYIALSVVTFFVTVLIANFLFGGDAPDVVDYLLFFGAFPLTMFLLAHL